MSNKSEPHHKFVQTFVLAEQPNGYFVLNDIFRYLNDDEDEIVEDEHPQPEVPAEEPPTPADGHISNDAQPEVVATEKAAEEVDVKLSEEQNEDVAPAEATEVNGALVPPQAEATAVAPESSEAPAEVAESAKAATPAPEQPAAPEATQAESTPESAAPATAAATDAPPAKKTWASMLGGGGAKAPAVPALPVTTSAAQPKAQRPSQPATAPKTSGEPATAPAPTSTAASTPTSQSNGWQTADHGKKGKPQNKAASEGVVLAYIKNVNEKVDARILREVLESFGELKYFDVSRPKVSGLVPLLNALTDHDRTVHSLNSSNLQATQRQLRQTHIPLAPNRSMSKSVVLDRTLMAVAMPATPVVAPLLDEVGVGCKEADLAARPTFPKMQDVAAAFNEVESRGQSHLKDVVKPRPL